MMNRPPLGPDPTQMNRDDLIRHFNNLRQENQQLRQENQVLASQQQQNGGNNNNTNNNNTNSSSSWNNYRSSQGGFGNNNNGSNNGSNPNSQQNSRASSAHSTSSSQRGGGFGNNNNNNNDNNSQQKYAVSMNVLVITGGEDHKCRTIPLQSVLEKGNAREVPYQREADTPINQMMAANAPHQKAYNNNNNNNNVSSDPFARHSLDAAGPGGPRFSNLDNGNPFRQSNSGNSSFDFGGNGGAGGGSIGGANATRLSALSPGDEANNNSITGNGPRPSNLNAGALNRNMHLDADSLVSNNTLHAFARSNADAPLSPQSMTATAMLKYLQETFAQNGFVHDVQSRQMEAVGRSLISICSDLERSLAHSAPHPELQSPIYVFGDIHGNFADLHYFMSTIMNFGDMRFVPLNILFLGDYVDRGPHGVEVVAFLFALKVLAPHKITLLRGNHEDTLVNGDLNLYRDTSFRYQCRNLFGDLLGEEVWLKCNRVFAHLPLTASIDKKIFCTHGGLPRYNGGNDNRMEMLKSRDPPRLDSFFQVPENESRTCAIYRQLACDVCWSDPAEDERMVDEHGFGNNPRGAGVILFGGNAVDRFLNNFGFEYIFRAHQEKSDGLKISKNARVVTVFSTSGYVGHQNGAGVVYVADGKIRLIIKEHEDEGTKVQEH